MSRPCECGHAESWHVGMFLDCLAALAADRRCDCRGYLERAPWLVRVWRWLKQVPR